MFRFATDGRVRWPLSLEQMEEGGGSAAQSFIVVYQVLTRDGLKARDQALQAYASAYRAQIPADGQADTAEAAAERLRLTEARVRDDDALLRERVKGWSGIVDEADQPIAFTAANLDAFLANALLRDALLAGLIEASTGARSKNSLPGLAGLPAPAQA